MFGLESGNKKKKSEEFIFDLEKDLKTDRAKIKKDVEERILQVKNILRSGDNKEEFDQMGVLLHGYTSLLRVISRVK